MAAVVQDDGADGCEAEPDATGIPVPGGLGAEKRLENALLTRVGDPRPVVVDLDGDVVRCRLQS